MRSGLVWPTATLLAVMVSAGTAFAADIVPEETLSPFSLRLEGWGGVLLYGDEKGDFDPANSTLGIIGADAYGRINLGDSFALQLDLSADATDNDEDFVGYDGSVLGGGHLNWNDPESGLFGIFGGYGEAQVEGNDVEFWFVGAEGQIYLESATLYGQFGYLDSEALDDVDDPADFFNNAFFGRLVGRYFLSPDSRLQAELAYANGDQDDDKKNMDVFSWGARFDYQFAENFSGFLGYSGAYFDNGNGVDTGSGMEHILRAGLSLSFGNSSDLMVADRNGPNLDLPRFGHWVVHGEQVD